MSYFKTQRLNLQTTGGIVKLSYLAVAFSMTLASLSPLHAVAVEKTAPEAPSMAAAMSPSDGKVISSMNASIYTYMELEAGKKRFWIAAPTTKVKVGDRVRFVESMAMENFNSKSLNRTFDRIIFVSSATVLK